MKIYNKKSFLSGMSASLLGLALLVGCILKTFDLKSVLLILSMLLIGPVEIRRSMSLQMSQEDKIEDMDERNRLIRLTSQSKACHITQGICFVLTLAFVVIGAATGGEMLLFVGIGFSFSFTVSMITEIISDFYYEKHT